VIQRRLPIFAKARAPKGRYYLTDNFLRAWLAALAGPVAAIHFRPVPELVAEADRRLTEIEGHGFEDLVAELYEERSRKALPGFSLSGRIEGYWNSKDTEIDLVALDEPNRTIRFGFCKRSADRLVAGSAAAEGHIERFLAAHRPYQTWTRERVALAPSVPASVRAALAAVGWGAEDLSDLLRGLLPTALAPDTPT
jgi:hypothetical protein